MNALDDLVRWVGEWTKSINDRRLPKFLAEGLVPKAEGKNECRFLKAFREDRTGFLSQVVNKLVGNTPIVQQDGEWTIKAGQHSLIDNARSNIFQTSKPFPLRGLELRLAMLWALSQGKHDPAHFCALIREYQKLFATKCWQDMAAYKFKARSAAFNAIASRGQNLANLIEAAVKKCKASFLDPAVAFLVDSIAISINAEGLERTIKPEEEPDLKHWHPGDTWALFIANNDGVLFRLRVEKVQYRTTTQDPQLSIGPFYPHPHLGFNLSIGDDFQEAIRNAWVAFQSVAAVNHKQNTDDFRWSLIPTQKEDHLTELVFRSSLSGDSATLAFFIGINSASEEKCVTPSIAASAAFDVGANANSINGSTTLKAVGGIPNKLDAASKLDAAFNQNKIKNLIVANGQTSGTWLPEDAIKPQSTVADAWRAMRTQEETIEKLADLNAGRWDRILVAGKAKDTAQ